MDDLSDAPPAASSLLSKVPPSSWRGTGRWRSEGLAPDYEAYVETRIDTESGWIKIEPLRWGMYAQQQEFLENIFENLLFTSFTPIDEDRVEMTVNAYIKDCGSSELNSAFGAHFMERFKCEVYQDLAILEHKTHLENPLHCAGDGDILRWRHYTRRFYSAPAAEGS